MKALWSSRGEVRATHTFTSKLLQTKISHQIYSFVKETPGQLLPQRHSAYTCKNGSRLMTFHVTVLLPWSCHVYTVGTTHPQPRSREKQTQHGFKKPELCEIYLTNTLVFLLRSWATAMILLNPWAITRITTPCGNWAMSGRNLSLTSPRFLDSDWYKTLASS